MKAIKRFFFYIAIIFGGLIACIVVLGQIPNIERVMVQTVGTALGYSVIALLCLPAIYFFAKIGLRR